MLLQENIKVRLVSFSMGMGGADDLSRLCTGMLADGAYLMQMHSGAAQVGDMQVCPAILRCTYLVDEDRAWSFMADVDDIAERYPVGASDMDTYRAYEESQGHKLGEERAPGVPCGKEPHVELALVPREPTDRLVTEILHGINRKRRDDQDLAETDVREVIAGLHHNGPYKATSWQ